MTLQHAKLIAQFLNGKIDKVARESLQVGNWPQVNAQWVIDADKVATGKAVRRTNIVAQRQLHPVAK